MRKPRGESQRGKSDAARAALAVLHEAQATRRAELVARIVAELHRRGTPISYPEAATIAGASVNTVKALARAGSEIVETKSDNGRFCVSLST